MRTIIQGVIVSVLLGGFTVAVGQLPSADSGKQTTRSRSVDDQLHNITTLIHSTWSASQSSASGFFYKILARDPEGTVRKAGYKRIEGLWLVTNRHVLVNDANELASSITFHHRKITEKGYEWVPITISGTDLHSRCRFHQSDDVDVAVISVLDLTIDVITPKREGENNILAFQSISGDSFPGTNKVISVDVGDDALVVGYPRGFYDNFSKFPIVKSGVIASRWGAPFGGQPYFLIDAKLFPGSSGSLVISRPTNLGMRNGGVVHTADGSKKFLFLGIYSGEPPWKMGPIVETDSFVILSKEGYNVGIVWYYHLIPTIISEGKQHPSKSD